MASVASASVSTISARVYAQDGRLWIAFVGAAVAITFFTIWMMPPFFMSNDDVGMRRTASGWLAGTTRDMPSEFLLFQNVLVGLFLKSLYIHFPGVYWYETFLYLLLSVSIGTLIFSIARLQPSAWPFLVYLLFLAPFVATVVLMLQFTAVAGFAAIAAVALTFSMIVREPRSPRGFGVSAISLLFVASLVRLRMAEIVPLLALPALLILLARANWRSTAVVIKIAVASVLVIACGVAFDWLYLDVSPGWGEFMEFNRIKGGIIDYHRVRLDSRTESLFRSIGWTPLDYEMLVNWFFTDTERFSLKNLRVVERAWAERGFLPAGILSVREFHRIAMAALTPSVGACAGLAVCLGALRSRWAALLASVGVALWFVLACIATALLFKTSPLWVEMPLCACSVTLAWFATQAFACGTNRWSKAVGLIAGLALVGSAARELDNEWAGRQSLAAFAAADMQSLFVKPAALYVTWGADFPWESAYRPFARQQPRFPYLSLGSANQTPLVQDALARFGIADLPKALCTRPDLLLLSTPARADLLVRYVRATYGLPAEQKVVTAGTFVNAYRCSVPP
jgi:hypothetical protein